MNYALLVDALEAVKDTPTAPLLWQRLAALIHALDGDARFAVIETLGALPLESKAAEWLRCSALAYLTRDPDWLARQASLVDEQTAPDAVMSLLAMIWHHGLVRSAAHKDFTTFMVDVNAVHLLRVASSKIRVADPPLRVASGPRLRVAVYTPEISDSHHGGTAMTLNVLSLMSTLDIDAHVFTAKEMSIPAIGSYQGGAEYATPLPVVSETLMLKAEGTVAISLPNGELSLRQRFVNVLQGIYAYAPDVVIFVGFMSPLAFRLYTHFPTIGLSLHALPPMVPVHVRLSAQAERNNDVWPDVPAPQVFPFPFRFRSSGISLQRDLAVMGLPADAVTLMTVGLLSGAAWVDARGHAERNDDRSSHGESAAWPGTDG